MHSCSSTTGAGAGKRQATRSTPRRTMRCFENKEWPEYYLTICDISSAQAVLAARFGVPVYAVGGSNGGRYAAVAAGVDKKFPGYVGISTADWGIKDAVLAQGGSGISCGLRHRSNPAPTCRRSPRARSGCSITRPTRSSPLPKARPSLQRQTSPRHSPSLMATTGSTRMSMPGS